MFARVTSSEIPSFKVKIISSQYMEWNNLGITTLKHARCSPNVF